MADNWTTLVNDRESILITVEQKDKTIELRHHSYISNETVTLFRGFTPDQLALIGWTLVNVALYNGSELTTMPKEASGVSLS